MKTVLEQMIENYEPKNHIEKKNAIKEVMQEIVLYCLSKSGFFDKAAFYGGTALRIFYGLDRFSEDLDFSLITKDNNFKLEAYLPNLKNNIEAFGLNVDIEVKCKSPQSAIQSAFLKAGTIEQFLLFYPSDLVNGINKNEKVKIKFEIDTSPAAGATYTTKYRLLPSPYSIKLFDEPSLFSGKIHAVICRSWKSRVKGRDLYDYIFYLSRNIRFNIYYLRSKLIESNFINNDTYINTNDVKSILINRFNEINFNDAKNDVYPFVKDTDALNIWSKEFFVDITSNLKEI